ncbi:MAG TPA: SLC13 family permease [Nitrososphaeraceae archaeon]
MVAWNDDNSSNNTGVFNWVAVKAVELSKGNTWHLMVILCIFTAAMAAFIDNVTIILLMIPVTLTIFKFLRRSPFPYVLGQAMCSNIGGAATLIGDPPNIVIGSGANIDFNSFILRLFFLREFKTNFDVKVLEQFTENTLVKDKMLLKKSLGILAAVTFLFTIQGGLNLSEKDFPS